MKNKEYIKLLEKDVDFFKAKLNEQENINKDYTKSVITCTNCNSIKLS